MATTKLLCLDPGVRCGFAYRDGLQLVSGVQEFDLRRGESPGMRLIRFEHWLVANWNGDLGPRPDLILYELPHHRGGYATEVLNHMCGLIQKFAATIGAEHKAVHTSTLKKVVAGYGKADKDQMTFAVGQAFPLHLGRRDCDYELSDHEVDALALLRWWDLGMPEGVGRKGRRRMKEAKNGQVRMLRAAGTTGRGM